MKNTSCFRLIQWRCVRNYLRIEKIGNARNKFFTSLFRSSFSSSNFLLFFSLMILHHFGNSAVPFVHCPRGSSVLPCLGTALTGTIPQRQNYLHSSQRQTDVDEFPLYRLRIWICVLCWECSTAVKYTCRCILLQRLWWIKLSRVPDVPMFLSYTRALYRCIVMTTLN